MKFLAPLFNRPSAEAIAKAELEDARRQLLAAESSAEYARQIAAYNKARIERLTAFLSSAAAAGGGK